MKYYLPRLDQLEERQLMAADWNPLPNDPQPIPALVATVTSHAEGESTQDQQSFVVSNPAIDYISTAIVFRSGSNLVVGSRTSSELIVVRNADSASPQTSFRLDLQGLSIQDMKVEGQRAIVVGQWMSNETRVLAIDLAAGRITSTTKLPPGVFSFLHVNNDDAWVVLDQATKPVVKESGMVVTTSQPKLIHFRWGVTGLTEESTLLVDHGLWNASGSRLIVASTPNVGESPTVNLSLYDLVQTKLSKVSTLDLGKGFVKSVVMSSDGQRASIIQSVGDAAMPVESAIVLLDLSQNAFKVSQTLRFNDFVEVRWHDAERALLYGQYEHELLSVDLRPIPSSTNRVTAFAIDPVYTQFDRVLELDGGRLAIQSYVWTQGQFFSGSPTNSAIRDGRYLLVIDPSSKTLKIQPGIDGKVTTLVPGTNKVGASSWGTSTSSYTIGRYDDQKGFVRESTFGGVDFYVDDVHTLFSNRLVTTSYDQVAIYDLSQGGKSLFRMKLDQKAPELRALDHKIQMTKEGGNFSGDWAVDDTTPRQARVFLVALEGAPSDVRLSDSQTITIEPSNDDNRQPIEFTFVISDGHSQAKGKFRVDFQPSMPRDIPEFTPGKTNVPLITNVDTNVRASSNTVDTSRSSVPTRDPLDVNQDGLISAIDALMVINALNRETPASTDPALDTNGSGLLDPTDALVVINYLNRISEAERASARQASSATTSGEGESVGSDLSSEYTTELDSDRRSRRRFWRR